MTADPTSRDRALGPFLPCTWWHLAGKCFPSAAGPCPDSQSGCHRVSFVSFRVGHISFSLTPHTYTFRRVPGLRFPNSGALLSSCPTAAWFWPPLSFTCLQTRAVFWPCACSAFAPCGLSSAQQPKRSSVSLFCRHLPALEPVHCLFPLPGTLFPQILPRVAPCSLCSDATFSVQPTLTSLFTTTASPSGRPSFLPRLPAFFHGMHHLR